MQSSETPGVGKDKDTPILTVSGFGAHRILSAEAGLHVFESSEGAASRVTARVRVVLVPLGDVPVAKEHKLIVEALEVGTAKRERDVVDELFATFGVNFAELEGAHARSRLGGKELRSAAPKR